MKKEVKRGVMIREWRSQKGLLEATGHQDEAGAWKGISKLSTAEGMGGKSRWEVSTGAQDPGRGMPREPERW